MSRPDVNPGATETQQMRVTAPVGVSLTLFLADFPLRYHGSLIVGSNSAGSLIYFFFPCTQANLRLRIRISYSMAGRPIQDQVDFSGFPPGLTG
jgi:AP-1 complex subunit gamma-1